MIFTNGDEPECVFFKKMPRWEFDARHDAVRDGAFEDLGELMNLCQGYLNALQVSTSELEEMIHIARANGALGAKLTGGGGGSIIALCPEDTERVRTAIQAAGYEAFSFEIN